VATPSIMAERQGAGMGRRLPASTRKRPAHAEGVPALVRVDHWPRLFSEPESNGGTRASGGAAWTASRSARSEAVRVAALPLQQTPEAPLRDDWFLPRAATGRFHGWPAVARANRRSVHGRPRAETGSRTELLRAET
jgi:hypothetical protein